MAYALQFAAMAQNNHEDDGLGLRWAQMTGSHLTQAAIREELKTTTGWGLITQRKQDQIANQRPLLFFAAASAHGGGYLPFELRDVFNVDSFGPVAVLSHIRLWLTRT